jgi:hypothetical protein
MAQQYRTTSTAKIIDSVTVNLNEPVKAKSLSGFLGGLDNPYYPDRNAIRVLQPKLMRTSHPIQYPEAYKLAGRVHFIISDEWKQLDNDKDGQIDLFDAKPYLDRSFEEYLDNLFAWGYNSGSIRPGIVWECWNEPDNNNFSGWIVQDFYETYKLTYTKLRESKLGTTALIAGPSFGTFNEQMMKDFFDYCLVNMLEVNVVTWHEITYLDQQKPLITLQQHVKYVRDNFINNPKYAPLKMQSIEINEIVNPEDKNRPSEIAGYLRNLEDAGVDYACKSCFTHNTNIDDNGSVLNEGGVPPCELGSCSDTSFNDLFTIWYDSEHYVNHSNICNPLPGNEHKTKSAWWVYKLYADGVPYRVQSTNIEPRSNVISSSKIQPYADASPTNTAQILVGYSNEWPQNSLPDTGTYSVRVNSLATINATAKIFRVKIFRIPFNGADSYNKAEDNNELLNPVLVSSAYYLADAKNGITIDFTAKTDDLYQITIATD